MYACERENLLSILECCVFVTPIAFTFVPATDLGSQAFYVTLRSPQLLGPAALLHHESMLTGSELIPGPVLHVTSPLSSQPIISLHAFGIKYVELKLDAYKAEIHLKFCEQPACLRRFVIDMVWPFACTADCCLVLFLRKNDAQAAWMYIYRWLCAILGDKAITKEGNCISRCHACMYNHGNRQKSVFADVDKFKQERRALPRRRRGDGIADSSRPSSPHVSCALSKPLTTPTKSHQSRWSSLTERAHNALPAMPFRRSHSTVAIPTRLIPRPGRYPPTNIAYEPLPELEDPGQGQSMAAMATSSHRPSSAARGLHHALMARLSRQESKQPPKPLAKHSTPTFRGKKRLSDLLPQAPRSLSSDNIRFKVDQDVRPPNPLPRVHGIERSPSPSLSVASYLIPVDTPSDMSLHRSIESVASVKSRNGGASGGTSKSTSRSDLDYMYEDMSGVDTEMIQRSTEMIV